MAESPEAASLSPEQRARRAAARVALMYAGASAVWIVLSDYLVAHLPLPASVIEFLNSAKGLAFVLVTGSILYFLAYRAVRDMRSNEAALRKQEDAIRKAYVDVLDAVTGGKLLLMTQEELSRALGTQLTRREPVGEVSGLSATRAAISETVLPWMSDREQTAAVLGAAGEALDNAVKHGKGAKFQVFATRNAIQVVVSDEGPGIDFTNLPKATLVPGYSSVATLGMGFTIMLQLSDRLMLATGPEGTTLALEFDALPAPPVVA